MIHFFSGKVDQKLRKPLHLLHLVYITYQKCIIFSKKGQKNGPNHLFFSDLIHFNSTNQSPRPYNCVNYTQKTKSLFCSSFQTTYFFLLNQRYILLQSLQIQLPLPEVSTKQIQCSPPLMQSPELHFH